MAPRIKDTTGGFAPAFADGWKKAGEKPLPEQLVKDISEGYGIHPTQVRNFIDAQSQHRTRNTPAPNPQDFVQPAPAPATM